MDKLGALKMFVVTAQLGSFSRAAEQLGKTPSALTKAVNHLESELGARLFERSQRGLDLHLSLANARGHELLLVLLPLTSAEGAQGYLARLGKLVHEHFGMSVELAGLGVKVLPYDLESARQRDGLRNFLYNECGLNDQQVAV